MEGPRRISFDFLKKYLSLRNVLIVFVFFFIYLMFSDLAKALIFTAIFVPVSIFSIKITRVMPHANIETLTSFSFFLGYLYGWPVGVFFGTFLGAYIWMTAYSLSQFVMLQLFLNGVTAFTAFFLKSAAWEFIPAYYLGMVIRNILYFVLGLAIGGNPLENTIHTITAVLANLIILPPLIFLLYSLAIHI